MFFNGKFITAFGEVNASTPETEAQLDEIIALQEDLVGVTIFYLDTIEWYDLKALTGMTWGEWIASTYNTAGFTADEDTGIVTDPNNRDVFNENDMNVVANDPIIAECVYTS